MITPKRDLVQLVLFVDVEPISYEEGTIRQNYGGINSSHRKESNLDYSLFTSTQEANFSQVDIQSQILTK